MTVPLQGSPMSFGSSIAGLFGRSPIKPLQQHYDTVHECALGLGEFFAGVSSNDWEKARAARQRIADLGNAITSQDGARLPGSRREAQRARIDEEGITVKKDLLQRIRSYTK